MKDFIETRIISAVCKLLLGRVNELLAETEYHIPLIEFSDYFSEAVVVPVISLTACEQSEKERIIRLDAYSLTITFSLVDTSSPKETLDSELHCYAYSGAVSRAFFDDPSLGGVADRALITNKKYIPPKNPHCGEGWGLVITLRVTVEGLRK